ncbi:MAG: quinone oxidoreductase [Geminicoccaceae bacterium]
MSKAIVQHSHGGPEVLIYEDVEVAAPGADEVTVRHTAIGVNFIDVYIRTGAYPLLTPPGVNGVEAAGVIEAIGSRVSKLRVGDRVAYVHNVPGAYSTFRTMPAAKLVKLRDDIDDRAAAAMLLKGMTAEYLLHRTAPVRAGDTILVHAAAGGVGLILTSWGKALGCTVIGTTSSEAKADLATAHGADHVIVTQRDSVAAKVAELTGGRGCRVVYDGVGKDTWDTSLEAIARHGHLVSYGNASGPVPPVNLPVLSPKCIALSRPTLFGYISTPDELGDVAGNLFDAMRSGAVRVDINQTYPLADAAQAHRDLEGRKTTGQTLLIP